MLARAQSIKTDHPCVLKLSTTHCLCVCVCVCACMLSCAQDHYITVALDDMQTYAAVLTMAALCCCSAGQRASMLMNIYVEIWTTAAHLHNVFK